MNKVSLFVFILLSSTLTSSTAVVLQVLNLSTVLLLHIIHVIYLYLNLRCILLAISPLYEHLLLINTGCSHSLWYCSHCLMEEMLIFFCSMQLAVDVQIPDEFGGLNGEAIYIGIAILPCLIYFHSFIRSFVRSGSQSACFFFILHSCSI